MDNSYENKTDNEIVKEIKEKQIAGFEELIKRYQNKLFVYVKKLTGSFDDSLDIVQETFIKFYENVQGFDDTRPFSPWIYRIAHNLAMNYLNKNKRSVNMEIQDMDRVREAKNDIEDLFNNKIKEEEEEQIVKHLARLKPKYKSILILYFMEEKSYEDIAEILRIPKSTVGVWLNRAKKELRLIAAEI